MTTVKPAFPENEVNPVVGRQITTGPATRLAKAGVC